MGLFNLHLEEWVREENWLVTEKHAHNCLTVEYDIGPCNCTPLQTLIWNGDPTFRKRSSDVLGAFEKDLIGSGKLRASRQPLPQEPTQPPTSDAPSAGDAPAQE